LKLPEPACGRTAKSGLNARNKLKIVLAPDNKKCSILVKRTNAPITYLNEMKSRLAKK